MSSRWWAVPRAALLSGVIVAGVGVSPVAAQAASHSGQVWVSSATQVYYQAADGRRNRVLITRSGRTIVVDDVVAIRAGKGCKPVKGDRTRVRCVTKKAPTKVTVNLGDRNDVLVNRTDLRLQAWGGTGNDTITGGAAHDLIQGDRGNDRLFGAGGADFLSGGLGNDVVDGGAADDVIVGDEGNDRLYGGPGGDSISGGDGNDLLWGGLGYDQLLGDSGVDRTDAGPTDDPSSRA